MGRVHRADTVDDLALTHGLLHVLGDIGDGQAPGGAELVFELERLHDLDILSAARWVGSPEPSVTLTCAGP